MNLSLRTKLEIAASLIFFAIVWWMATPKHAPVGTTVIATAAPELANAPKQNITPSQVPVYTPPAKKKLELPSIVQDDPNKYVLGSAKLPADTHPHTVTEVIDSKTGEVQMYDRRDPLPWLAAEQHGEFGIGWGFKNGQKAEHLFLREEIGAIKAAHLGGGLHWFTDGTNMIEVTVAGKW